MDAQTRIDPRAAAAVARSVAIAAARPIFYRPESVVAELIAAFADLPEADYPGADGVTRRCFGEPIRRGATAQLFGLRPLHWPMLNLLDSAERQRRSFADAVAAAVSAARAQ